ncbi:hypothetical protein NDK47_00970 [Brevibacillus ruminantium]|uniref:Uncharacterized protein n=1 Tax=Brevibacillus ruminantium TaxID=2950604 RepID=A0ABY4WFM7_9BACL|nr:hypothetical protein [Brevibacillus ruminantium]USG65961.1 hypothetical protein NDK47_00970 [Brevibacillus ruminantium]
MMKRKKMVPILALTMALVASNVYSITHAAGNFTTYTNASEDEHSDREVGSYSQEFSHEIQPLDTGISYYRDGYVKGSGYTEYYKDDKRFYSLHKEYVTVAPGVEVKAQYTRNVSETVDSKHSFKGDVEFPISLVKTELGYQYTKSTTHEIKKGQAVDATFKQPGEYLVVVWAVGEVYEVYADWRAKVYPNKDTIVRDRYIGSITVPTNYQHTEVIKQ